MRRVARFAFNFHTIPRAPTVKEMQLNPEHVYQRYHQRERDAEYASWGSLAIVGAGIAAGYYANKYQSTDAKSSGILIGGVFGFFCSFVPMVTLPYGVYRLKKRSKDGSIITGLRLKQVVSDNGISISW